MTKRKLFLLFSFIYIFNSYLLYDTDHIPQLVEFALLTQSIFVLFSFSGSLVTGILALLLFVE